MLGTIRKREREEKRRRKKKEREKDKGKIARQAGRPAWVLPVALTTLCY